MAPELIVRAGYNDHEVIADLLAPRGPQGGARPPVSRVVVDAHHAVRRQQVARAASQSGTPMLIDPVTHLFQGQPRELDSIRSLPYAELASSPELSGVNRDHFVESVVDFQLEQGATSVIPPYFYASSPGDPCFGLTIDLLVRTADYLKRENINVPLIPLACVKLQGFSDESMWVHGLGRFSSIAADSTEEFVAVCLSPAGTGKEGYHKVLTLFETALRVRQAGQRVIAWRQGFFGPPLAAAGIDGYECGIGTAEQCDVRSMINSRKRKPSGGMPTGVLLEPFGKSTKPVVAQALLQNELIRAQVMCLEVSCCPNGWTSTLERPKEHAINARWRYLQLIGSQPHRRWRLYQVERDAHRSVNLALQANKILEEVGLKDRIRGRAMESLARLCRKLREEEEGSQVA